MVAPAKLQHTNNAATAATLDNDAILMFPLLEIGLGLALANGSVCTARLN
jgi:hypothetical protein